MALLAKLYPQAATQRRDVRYKADLDATLRDAALTPIDISISDLSANGFRATFPEPQAVGAVIRIGISGIGMRHARIARRDGNEHGCEFQEAVSEAAVAQALDTNTVVRAHFGDLPLRDPHAAPLDERWPGWVRLSLVVTLPALLWGGLIWMGTALFEH